MLESIVMVVQVVVGQVVVQVMLQVVGMQVMLMVIKVAAKEEMEY